MTEKFTLVKVQLKNPDEALALLGNGDTNIKILEDELDVSILTRGEMVHVSGSVENVELVSKVLETLLNIIRQGIQINGRDVMYAIEMAKKGNTEEYLEIYNEEIGKNAKGKAIRVKTIGQREYLEKMKRNDLVFAIGPAGTGKTYLAVVMAVHALKKGFVKRVILTRPAVEAGENLGFLPGDLKEKVDPYLRPLYDALHDVLGVEHTTRLIDRGVIEIAPLAYMRGRTLDDAFVILDEAQNTTRAQMKMFLTRLGFGSKMVITGDKTQIDLPKGAKSGLIEAEQKLQQVKGIGMVYLDQTDVVRHPLVARIIEAYEKDDEPIK